eukprot:Nk52_evm53s32 gene=Nk52_evmTU53s32
MATRRSTRSSSSRGLTDFSRPLIEVEVVNRSLRKTKKHDSNNAFIPTGQANKKRATLSDVTNANVSFRNAQVGKNSGKMVSKTRTRHHPAYSISPKTKVEKRPRQQSKGQPKAVPLYNDEASEYSDSEMAFAGEECSEVEQPNHENVGHDIDEECWNDQQMCAEYANEIFSYLLHREQDERVLPKPDYMRKQKDINDSMRLILVDWLVDVAEEYKLQRETLFLAINYIDRFLSNMAVNRPKLQLVGITCMLLASKCEELYPPPLEEFVYISDNTYTKAQILKMESIILKVLQFDMNAVTSCSLSRRLLQASAASSEEEMLCNYLLELTLLDSCFLQYSASCIATSSVIISRAAHRSRVWSGTFEKYCPYSIEDVEECIAQIVRVWRAHLERQDCKAVNEKYNNLGLGLRKTIPSLKFVLNAF